MSMSKEFSVSIISSLGFLSSSMNRLKEFEERCKEYCGFDFFEFLFLSSFFVNRPYPPRKGFSGRERLLILFAQEPLQEEIILMSQLPLRGILQ